MHQAHAVSAMKRAIAGIFAGAIFGLLVEVFVFDPPPGKFPVVGLVVGAVVLALVSMAIGGKEIRGRWRLLAIGVVAGALGGLAAGILVYVPWAMASDPMGETVFHEKAWAIYQRDAVFFGGRKGDADRF